MIGWLRAQLTSLASRRVRGLSLVANWLAGVLWLIETTFLALAQKAYSKNSVVYSTLRVLSTSVAEAPLRAYQVGADGEERTPLPRDHLLVQLLKRPNELMTEYELKELVSLQLAIVGRSHWWKQRDNTGTPAALWPLRPDRVGPVYATPEDERRGTRVLRGWSYQDPGTGEFIEIARQDVLTFNLPDPAAESGGIVEGLGPLQALASEISSDNEATAFVGALLANYAAPTVALKVKEPIKTEKEAQLIKAAFRAEFGGAKRGTPAVVDAGADIQVLGFNLEQLEFPSLRDVSESRVCAAVGVPAILVGLKVGLQSGIRATISEQRAYFTETTLANYWHRLSDQFTSDVAAEFGEGILVEFDTSQVKALSAQRREQIAPVAEGFARGSVTVNEYRKALGLDAAEGGDVYLVPQNVTVKATLEEAEPPMLPAGQEPAQLPAGRRPPALPPGRALRVADPRDDAEARLRAALESLLDRLGREIAGRIRRGEPISDQELADAFRGLLEVELTRTATDEVLRLGESVGVQFDPAVANLAAAEWARSYTYQLVSGLTATTRPVIASAVARFTGTPGMTVGDLAALLEPAFGAVRAEMIAVTETTRAYAAATAHYQKMLADEGITMERVWHTSHDERVCPICVPLNGKAEGGWGEGRGGGPPAHVNCRCSVALRMPREAEGAA